MANYADASTDNKLAEMEKHLKEIYSDAYKGIDKSWRQYIKGYDEMVDGKTVHHKGLAERYVEEYKAYQDGKYSKAQFDAWYAAQVGRGERWEALKDDMVRRTVDANITAAAYINDNTPWVYALNANFAAYEIEKGTGIAFNLVDEQTIKRLSTGKNHIEFRTLSVNPKRDYNWNTQKIQKALLSGILQGNSIDKLTDKFMEVMQNNRNAAIRNARTAVTSAQNGGRQASYDQAIEKGIVLQKEWISTDDNRTRDSHMELDGVRVENNEKFPNGCMYPGDPAGEPGEVYNCRCTMRAILPKYNGAKRTDKTKESYEKWLAEKEQNNVLVQTAESAKDAFTFTPAGDIKEVKERMSDALGIPEEDITLGRMKLELANEYLEGIEIFTNEFPQIKGLYTGFDTAVGGGGGGITLGVNKISADGRRVNGIVFYDCRFDLALKSPRNLQDLRDAYAYGIKSKQHYDNASPKATAIHELTHGLDYALKMHERGYFVNGVLQTTIESSEWNQWASTVSKGIVEETKMEIFGALHGKDVYDGISYLGSYSLNNSKEMLAEAISYELSGAGTNVYSAKMLEKLREKVSEVFK